MDISFQFVFPSIRGVQARREFFVSMCPLRMIPRLFDQGDQVPGPEDRAQRLINRGRVPEITAYIIENPRDYIFSAVTISLDGEAWFDPVGLEGDADQIGLLHIAMDTRFVINDGQHRYAAIVQALRQDPDLGDESISVVFYVDKGLKRSQQMFADLNRYGIRPSRSLSILYDHRDPLSGLARTVAEQALPFKSLVDLERSSLPLRSEKLFTLSAIFFATMALVKDFDMGPEDQLELALEYWNTLAKNLTVWQQVIKGETAAFDARATFVNCHGVVLQALGKLGQQLIRDFGAFWPEKIAELGTINWARNNATLWEGRCLVAGRVSNAGQNVVLVVNAIKQHLGQSLCPEEQKAEDAFLRRAQIGGS